MDSALRAGHAERQFLEGHDAEVDAPLPGEPAHDPCVWSRASQLGDDVGIDEHLPAPKRGAAASATRHAEVAPACCTDLRGGFEETAPPRTVVAAFELLDRHDDDERAASALDGLRVLACLLHELGETSLCVGDTPATPSG